jgi:hypothetical protein
LLKPETVMTDPTATPQNPTGFNRVLPWLLPAILIGNFLWRVLTPAHEYPGRSSTILEMVIDAALIAGLFGIKARMPYWLFWIALLSGISLFLIRLTSEASWWTGHVRYYVL